MGTTEGQSTLDRNQVDPEVEEVTNDMSENTTKTNGNPAGDALETARDKLREAAGDLKRRYDAASEDVRRGAERASEEIHRTTRQVQAKARKARRSVGRKARQGYDQATEGLRKGYDRLQHDVRQAGHDLDDYVRQNPGKSLLIATAVGFVVGLLMRRSGDR